MNGMSLQEIQQHMENLKEWSLSSNSIEKVFSFNTFKESIAFVNKIGEIAEKHNHHPDIMINYNIVSLSLTTHNVKGLTKADFDVAKEIDKI